MQQQTQVDLVESIPCVVGGCNMRNKCTIDAINFKRRETLCPWKLRIKDTLTIYNTYKRQPYL